MLKRGREWSCNPGDNKKKICVMWRNSSPQPGVLLLLHCWFFFFLIWGLLQLTGKLQTFHNDFLKLVSPFFFPFTFFAHIMPEILDNYKRRYWECYIDAFVLMRYGCHSNIIVQNPSHFNFIYLQTHDSIKTNHRRWNWMFPCRHDFRSTQRKKLKINADWSRVLAHMQNWKKRGK